MTTHQYEHCSLDILETDVSLLLERDAKVTEHLDTMYSKLNSYSISLDRDPSSVSLTNLSGKLSIAREYANNVASYVVNLLRLQTSVSEQLQAYEQSLKDAVGKAIYLDESCQKAKGWEEKNLLAEKLSPNLVAAKRILSKQLERVKTCYKVCSFIYSNLINSKEDILSQLGVIKQQLAVGEIFASTPHQS